MIRKFRQCASSLSTYDNTDMGFEKHFILEEMIRMTSSTALIGFSFIGFLIYLPLLLGSIAGLILLIMVLFKLNKALNIWLEKNKRE